MAKISIFVGSMYGNAENLANDSAELLNQAGHEAHVVEPATLADLKQAENILFISSTTGAGDIPDNLLPLFLQMQSEFPMLTGKQVAVIALGDRSYGDTYCGAGKQIDALVEELNATRVQARLDIDACEHFEPWEPAKPWLQSLADKL
ncbi:flavodoxin [Pseudoalteromonas sp. McH1-7]|uniref:MioC protein n=1 Tax=Pseudoalteromonas peptidolytica F12-50-A1 TaxID=1315280 RepID=A0A8I0T4Z9_9GAMM|nr:MULTISPECIES: flavodoxin [Pseudoalteromonas]MBE0345709.1 MioC protein [Pseudoalteromonas peptidolytica F12-50-A1]MDW7547808.1 flavodoxin [Pseudoalteromonas peptidolytica]NLR14327.1 flavodoxin [Pseudoalteromonas peptidolytica]NUZ11354.1 flavodoxin [Pseudoalteromonas sp. McH1-7]RRS08629.1 flavodoxin [Pseudoalteromonas sp. J010]